MHLLQVVPSFYPAFVYGGPIFSVHHACQSMARSGICVKVATTNANGRCKLDVETRRPVAFEKNYRVHYYDDTVIGRFSWAFTRNLWRDIRSADVVHVQGVFSAHAAWTLLLAALQRRPTLVSPQGSLSPWALKAKRRWLKAAWLALVVRPFIKDARRVAWHATSASEQGEILVQFPKGCVHVVPNGIECTSFDAVMPLSRAEYFATFFPGSGVAADQATAIGGLGRLHAVKGFNVAVRTLHALAKRYPNLVLLIAGGDDGERDALQRLIDELQLARRVTLVGELQGEKKIAFLKGADVFLFPSHSESFGMVCLEALAAGVPVVASRNTPWAELERDGAGRWVDNTAEAFARATAELLAGDLTAMRQAARKHAALYDLESIAERFRAIYQDLIDAQRSTS